jgi:hypothetical protein
MDRELKVRQEFGKAAHDGGLPVLLLRLRKESDARHGSNHCGHTETCQISTAYGIPKEGATVIPRNKYAEIRREKPQLPFLRAPQ